jgi:chloramphenicol 3-O-phosphotransferase
VDGAAEGKHETVAEHHASHRVELDSVHALQVVLVGVGAHQSLEVAIHREAQQNLLRPGCCRKIKNESRSCSLPILSESLYGSAE